MKAARKCEVVVDWRSSYSGLINTCGHAGENLRGADGEMDERGAKTMGQCEKKCAFMLIRSKW